MWMPACTSTPPNLNQVTWRSTGWRRVAMPIHLAAAASASRKDTRGRAPRERAVEADTEHDGRKEQELVQEDPVNPLGRWRQRRRGRPAGGRTRPRTG